MHDEKLLRDNQAESTESRDEATAMAGQTSGHRRSRASVWTVIGFCIAGLICSIFVPTSYLRFEQTSAVLAEAPLS